MMRQRQVEIMEAVKSSHTRPISLQTLARRANTNELTLKLELGVLQDKGKIKIAGTGIGARPYRIEVLDDNVSNRPLKRRQKWKKNKERMYNLIVESGDGGLSRLELIKDHNLTRGMVTNYAKGMEQQDLIQYYDGRFYAKEPPEDIDDIIRGVKEASINQVRVMALLEPEREFHHLDATLMNKLDICEHKLRSTLQSLHGDGFFEKVYTGERWAYKLKKSSTS